MSFADAVLPATADYRRSFISYIFLPKQAENPGISSQYSQTKQQEHRKICSCCVNNKVSRRS